MGLPPGFAMEHNNRTITGQTAVRGYGLRGTQPHYVFHNVPESLEVDFMDFVNKRANYFDWDDTSPEGTTDITMHNDGQRIKTIQFYRLVHDYVKADDALLNLICTFLCWEQHYTGHAHSKKSSPRKWCYKHRVVYEVTCGLGYILLINTTLLVPPYRTIRAHTRGYPAYAEAQDAWRQLKTPIALADHRVTTLMQDDTARRPKKKTSKKRSSTSSSHQKTASSDLTKTPQTPQSIPRDRLHTFLDSPDSADDEDDEDQADDGDKQTTQKQPIDDDSDTDIIFPALSLPRLDLDHQTPAEMTTHDQAMRQLIQTFYHDLLQQIRHRQALIETSLAVVPSLRQQMSDLDHRIQRHEAYLYDTQSQFNRYKRTLLNKLNKFIPVFADLQRRQDTRFPKLSVEQRYREEEERDAGAGEQQRAITQECEQQPQQQDPQQTTTEQDTDQEVQELQQDDDADDANAQGDDEATVEDDGDNGDDGDTDVAKETPQLDETEKTVEEVTVTADIPRDTSTPLETETITA